jgi:hypothetical protein
MNTEMCSKEDTCIVSYALVTINVCTMVCVTSVGVGYPFSAMKVRKLVQYLWGTICKQYEVNRSMVDKKSSLTHNTL